MALKELKVQVCKISESVDAYEIDEVSAQVEGKSVQIGAARMQACEVLFDPSIAGKTCMSLPQAIYASVMGVEPPKRVSLWEGMILTGGTSEIPGMIISEIRIERKARDRIEIIDGFDTFI